MKRKYFTEEEKKNAEKKRYLDNKENILKYQKEYYQSNKKIISIRNKQRYENKKEKILKKQKIYEEKHRKEKRIYAKKWYQKNKKDRLIQCKKYRKTHKKEINQYFTNKKQINIDYKLTCVLRTRLYIALKNNQKSGSAVEDLGCSIPELKTHLESKFQEGMTWKNWGIYGWHIDHIIPLTSFDLTNREKLLKACHYTNLQPLWAEENLKKGKTPPLSVNVEKSKINEKP